MRYEQLDPLSRADAATEMGSADWERISVTLVRLALHDPDPEWLQATILPFTEHEHHWVRGIVAVSLGHVARLHRRLDVPTCLAANRPPLQDSRTRGHAGDALDDIEMFISMASVDDDDAQ